MKIRAFLESHSRVTAVVGVIAIAFAIRWSILTVRRGMTPPTAIAGPVWYMDLNSGKLFIDSDQPPPIATASGLHDGKPAGVRAYVFACGDCADPEHRFTAWLETYTPEAQQAAGQISVPMIGNEPGARSEYLHSAITKGIMIKTPEATEWVDYNSPQSAKIMATTTKQCKGKPAAMECPAK